MVVDSVLVGAVIVAGAVGRSVLVEVPKTNNSQAGVVEKISV